MYSRNVNNQEFTFGVSGLLYKANVLMYDRQTESLWSQAKRQAVAGPMTGAKLAVLPSVLTSWEKWVKRHPDTMVLSLDTGYNRDYDSDPYASYYKSSRGFFSLFDAGPGEEEKALVAGLVLNGTARAYPLDLLRKAGPITDRLDGLTLTIAHDAQTDRISVSSADGSELEVIVLYWFVWKGMYPQSSLYRQ